MNDHRKNGWEEYERYHRIQVNMARKENNFILAGFVIGAALIFMKVASSKERTVEKKAESGS